MFDIVATLKFSIRSKLLLHSRQSGDVLSEITNKKPQTWNKNKQMQNNSNNNSNHKERGSLRENKKTKEEKLKYEHFHYFLPRLLLR